MHSQIEKARYVLPTRGEWSHICFMTIILLILHFSFAYFFIVHCSYSQFSLDFFFLKKIKYMCINIGNLSKKNCAVMCNNC
jgi:hypothetical protein